MPMQRKIPDDYHKLAQERGFRWLGPEVPNTRPKTGWECSHGHRWETRYSTIQAGCGCPHCSRKARKIPDFHKLAQERGFRWVGPETNARTKTGWECEQGHRWMTTYYTIQKGHGCPICSGKARKTPADYHALAEKRGFRWLGPEVRNIQTRTGWECEQGHRWMATYSTVRKGTGCPLCSRKRNKR